MNVQQLKSNLIRRASELDNPSLEVRIILEHSCSLSTKDQILYPGKEISEEDKRQAEAMLDRRLSGYPMAYIIGEKEFYGSTFKVTEDTLIPRPDTETIVDKAIEIAKNKINPKILDMCTGSGAIGISIAKETGIDVSISDISKDALDVAIYNYRNIIKREPDARLGSLFECWEGEKFDIIATNPPYLNDKWYEEVSIEVKKEPKLALIGFEDDGLGIIRQIIEKAQDYLEEDGYLLIEQDYRQIGICVKLLALKGFKDIRIAKDLAEKERVVYARRE